jgi:hypothetical protein
MLWWLCQKAMARSIEPEYTRRLVEKLNLDGKSAAPRPTPLPPPPAPRRVAVPPDFARELRAALRRFHETRRLAESPLLEYRTIAERAAGSAALPDRVEALRAILRDAVDALGASARTETSYRALYHTYIEPAPTQLLAAETARLSFGTYRRHLAGGLDELAATLWLREQALLGSALS